MRISYKTLLSTSTCLFAATTVLFAGLFGGYYSAWDRLRNENAAIKNDFESCIAEIAQMEFAFFPDVVDHVLLLEGNRLKPNPNVAVTGATCLERIHLHLGGARESSGNGRRLGNNNQIAITQPAWIDNYDGSNNFRQLNGVCEPNKAYSKVQVWQIYVNVWDDNGNGKHCGATGDLVSDSTCECGYCDWDNVCYHPTGIYTGCASDEVSNWNDQCGGDTTSACNESPGYSTTPWFTKSDTSATAPKCNCPNKKLAPTHDVSSVPNSYYSSGGTC